MKKKLILILIIGFVFHFEVNSAQLIQNPVQDYFNADIHQEDKLLVYTVDMNEDGQDEFFISTDSEYLSNSKAGRSWTMYISVQGGYIYSNEKSKVSATFDPPNSLVRLNNGRLAIIHYAASNARTGSLLVYYLDTNNVLTYEKLGEIFSEPGEFGKKYSEALSDKVIPASDSKTSFKVHKLEDIYTPAQISGLKSYKDEFIANHYYRSDPDDPQADLVFRKSDNILVGREKFGVFTPLKKTEMTSKQIQHAKDMVKPGPGTPGYVPPTNKVTNNQTNSDTALEVVDKYNILLVIVLLILGFTLYKRNKNKS